jgi:hypothetical protein
VLACINSAENGPSDSHALALSDRVASMQIRARHLACTVGAASDMQQPPTSLKGTDAASPRYKWLQTELRGRLAGDAGVQSVFAQASTPRASLFVVVQQHGGGPGGCRRESYPETWWAGPDNVSMRGIPGRRHLHRGGDRVVDRFEVEDCVMLVSDCFGRIQAGDAEAGDADSGSGAFPWDFDKTGCGNAPTWPASPISMIGS